MTDFSFLKRIDTLTHACQYSICTLVTNKEEYYEMVQSFIDAGFDTSSCEYLYIDNTGNRNAFDAYSGLNALILNASGQYLIFCHQDVLLRYDKRAHLEENIKNLNKVDSSWAVLGNAGGNNLYNVSAHITEANKQEYYKGKLPSKVHSLDENFILVKSQANLAFSSDLHGFHFYGTDICLIAECLGHTAYAIDFHLYHRSSGKPDKSFFQLKKAIRKKYIHFFRGRYIRTTFTKFYISGNAFLNVILSWQLVINIVRLFYKYRYIFFKKL